MTKKKIYISGAISNDPGYKQKFDYMSSKLSRAGFTVLYPTMITAELDYEEYMIIDFAMISVCDAIYMLKDWKNSSGACRELKLAKQIKKEIIYEGNEPWNN